MNKLITSVICAATIAFGAFADTNDVTNAVASVKDVYTFEAKLNIPYLMNGVRNYSKQTLKGDMYVEYATSTSGITKCYVVAQNKKTGVTHEIDFSEGFYNLLGKQTKTAVKSVPTVYFAGTNCVVKGENAHEKIVAIQLAGTGKLAKSKTTTVECGVCSADRVSTEYCNVLKSMNGSVTGVMDCECPEGDPWDHTLEAGPCGPLTIDGAYVRTHFASFWGTFKATPKKNK